MARNSDFATSYIFVTLVGSLNYIVLFPKDIIYRSTQYSKYLDSEERYLTWNRFPSRVRAQPIVRQEDQAASSDSISGHDASVNITSPFGGRRKRSENY